PRRRRRTEGREGPGHRNHRFHRLLHRAAPALRGPPRRQPHRPVAVGRRRAGSGLSRPPHHADHVPVMSMIRVNEPNTMRYTMNGANVRRSIHRNSHAMTPSATRNAMTVAMMVGPVPYTEPSSIALGHS